MVYVLKKETAEFLSYSICNIIGFKPQNLTCVQLTVPFCTSIVRVIKLKIYVCQQTLTLSLKLIFTLPSS
jgi:hypothetical protein